MAITVDWPNRIINVPRADMPLIQAAPQEIRRLDLDDFRRELRALEADVFGRAEPITHTHALPSLLGGVEYARQISVVNGYTVTFEDGMYAVSIVGGNSNVADVANVNQVSVRPNNSAGLVGLTAIEERLAALEADHQVINEGVKRASVLRRHNQDLP